MGYSLVGSAGIPNSYGSSAIYLYVQENTDPDNNRSSFSWYLDLYCGFRAWHYDVNCPWSVYVGNQWWSGNQNYDFPSGGGTKRLASGSSDNWIGHNADGTGSYSVYADFNGDGPLGSGNTGWQGYGMSDYYRPPTATSAPSITTRASGGTSITMSASGTVGDRPAVDYFRWRMYANGGGTPAVVDTGSPYAWPNANTDTDYYVTAQAHNSEGFGPESAAWAYAAPRITAINVPNQGTVGKPYSGSVSGNNVDSYSAVNGSLPPGLSFSGGTLSGSPTLPGIYTFNVRATRNGVSYVDSAQQTIQVLAGGPWIKTPAGTPVFSGNISNVAVTSNVATITTSSAHGIEELNQPITIAGLTGAHAVLNGNWAVQSWPTTTKLTFNTTGLSNIASATALGTGTYTSLYKRTSLKVYVGGQWVQAWMRYWDSASSTWKTTA